MPERVFISTMPKSGTWYVRYFFWTLQRIMKDKTFSIENYEFDGKEHFTLFEFAKIRLEVGHGICPGYLDLNKEKDQFKNLYHKVSEDTMKKLFAYGYSLSGEFNPAINPNAKIIYIYRNPLDQALSAYRHSKNHVDPNFRQAAESLNLNNYLLSTIDKHVRQHHTFMVMKRHYPKQIMMVTYEELVQNPEKTFKAICDFSNLTTSKHLINLAIKNSSKDKLKNVEKRLKHPLANDQQSHNKQTSHIRSGKIGEWKQFITAETVAKVDEKLKEFGYSINDFTLEPTLYHHVEQTPLGHDLLHLLNDFFRRWW